MSNDSQIALGAAQSAAASASAAATAATEAAEILSDFQAGGGGGGGGTPVEVVGDGDTITLAADAAIGTTAVYVVTDSVSVVGDVAYAGEDLATATVGTWAFIVEATTGDWVAYKAGAGSGGDTPAAPAPSISGTPTETTATVAWSAVTGADSYDVRVNGGTPVTGVTSPYTATGLPHTTPFTIEVRAVNTAGNSSWAVVGGTTASPTATGVRLNANKHATVTESGDSNGWTYAFAETPYNSGAGTTVKIPAGADGYVEWTDVSLAAGDYLYVSLKTGNNPTGSNTYNYRELGVVYPAASNTKYTPQAAAGAGTNQGTYASGNRLRLGRTGTTLYLEVSADGGTTWTRLHTRTSVVSSSDSTPTNADNLYLVVMAAVALTATIGSVRGVGFS